MKTVPNAQELARRFHENEAVRLCYERKRKLRLSFGKVSPLPEEILDRLDWLEAEKECRITRAIGLQMDE